MKITREFLRKAFEAELDQMHFIGDEIDIAYGRIEFAVIVENHEAKLLSGLYQTMKTYDLEKMRFTQPQLSRSKI